MFLVDWQTFVKIAAIAVTFFKEKTGFIPLSKWGRSHFLVSSGILFSWKMLYSSGMEFAKEQNQEGVEGVDEEVQAMRDYLRSTIELMLMEADMIVRAALGEAGAGQRLQLIKFLQDLQLMDLPDGDVDGVAYRFVDRRGWRRLSPKRYAPVIDLGTFEEVKADFEQRRMTGNGVTVEVIKEVRGDLWSVLDQLTEAVGFVVEGGEAQDEAAQDEEA